MQYIVHVSIFIYAIPTSSTQKLAVLIVLKNNMVLPLVIEYCLDQLVTNLPVHVYMCSYIINMYFEMLL